MATVLISIKAQKQIGRLETSIKARIGSRVQGLALYPNVPGVRALSGSLKGYLRIRVGDFRIIFSVSGSTVTVTSVDDRKDVYERDVDVSRDRGRWRVSTRSGGYNHAFAFVLRSLGTDLKAARLHAGYTQPELARRLRRSQTSVSKSEAGRFLPSQSYVLAVLRVCGLPAHWRRRDG